MIDFAWEWRSLIDSLYAMPKIRSRLLSLVSLGVLLILHCSCVYLKPHTLPGGTPERRAAARKEIESWTDGQIFTFNGRDGKPLLGRCFSPKGKPKAVAILFHGIESHALWSGPVSDGLVSQGIELWVPDRRGSGLNSGTFYRAGDIDERETLIEDAACALDFVHSQRPKVPLHAIGVSWGAFLLPCVVDERPNRPGVKAMRSGFFMVPAYATKAEPEGALRTFLKLIVPVVPSLRLSPPTDPAWFDDKEVMPYVVEEDALIVRSFTLRFINITANLRDEALVALPKLPFPIKVLLCERDGLVDNDKVKVLLEPRLPKGSPPIEELKDANHVVEIEHPNRVAPIIAKWLLGER